MFRREFLKTSAGLSAGFLLLPANTISCNAYKENSPVSRVVISVDKDLFNAAGAPDEQRVAALLDNAMCRCFNTDDPVGVWLKKFSPGETVGLKINCLSGEGSTHHALANAITERLQQAGIRKLIIWDRFNSDLEDAGYRITYKNSNVLCFGNDAAGFEDHFESFGKAASLVCKTLTRHCDSIINIPLMKDHGIAGMTMAMKNMFGAIHNPHKFHLDVGDPYIADVFCYPSIRRKVKLHIADAIWAQYEGGPSFMPQWRWPYGGIIVSGDPVAMDYTGWQIIEKKRAEEGLKTLRSAGREPSYIRTAANPEHKLGHCNPDEISIIKT